MYASGHAAPDISDDEVWAQLEAARDVEANGAEPVDTGPAPDADIVELFDQRAVTAHWLDQQTFPPLEWIVEGILPEGMGLLVAPPKAGKSWWVGGIGLACAAGGYALGKIPVDQRPVLYLALEDGHRRLQGRLRHLNGDDPLPRDLTVITKASSAESLVLIDEFLRRNRDKAPLVIIDTLGKIKPPKRSGEESYQADYRIGSALKERIDDVPGGCLLLVHHTRKAESTDFIDAVSGTQGIAGSADFVLVLSRKRKAADAILAVTGRDVIENEYALLTEDGDWSLAGMDLMDSAAIVEQRQETQNKGDRTVAALTFVNGRPETKAADLAEHLDISNNDAGTYLRRLARDGAISNPSRGTFTPLSEVSEVSEIGAPTEPRHLQVLPTSDRSDTSDTHPNGGA